MSESKELEVVEIHPLELSASTAAWIREELAASVSESTWRGWKSDMRRFGAWLGQPVTFPLSVVTVLKFIEEHREKYALGTIERMLATLSTGHNQAEEAGKIPEDSPNAARSKQVRRVMIAARKNDAKAGIKPAKKRAATRDIIDQLIAVCDDSLRGKRDKAIIRVGFSSGGRRRSELAGLKVEDLTDTPDGYLWDLGVSKTNQEGAFDPKPIKNDAALFLREWLEASGIESGYVFRGITKSGTLWNTGKPMHGGRAIAQAIQARAKQAQLDHKAFGGHSLRSGYVTEAGRSKEIARESAMNLTGHRSATIFNSYYQAGDVMKDPAGDL